SAKRCSRRAEGWCDMAIETIGTMTGEEMIALSKKHTMFEWAAQSKVDPIPVARARGIYFWTPEGKRFIDFNSQLMCVNIGHGNERVIRAIHDQAAVLAYANPFMAAEPGLPGVVHVLDPYHGVERGWDSAEQSLAMLEEVIQLEGPQTIAAFILETVTGTNGVLVPPDGYMQGVRELCTKYGILMICD